MTDLQEFVRDQEEALAKLSTMREHYTRATRESGREDSDVDYARVLYSSSFRRLQGKMQLLSPESNKFYRNRLTHSMEVAQICKSLAKRLHMKDTTTVQTCALAHDLGNPPFGHAGEQILSNLSDGLAYEGNAQTFRILHHLEDKFPECNGLDLTLRTLVGVVKYPNNRRMNPKKFLYDDDFDLIQKWRREYNLNLKTLDCQILDLADEIAYAAHDLEDCLRMRYFSIEELIHEFSIHEVGRRALPEFRKLVDSAQNYAMKAKSYRTSEEYFALFIRELTSVIVNHLVTGIRVTMRPDSEQLGYTDSGDLACALKTLTFASVKRRPDVIRYELMGKKVLMGLFEVFSDKTFNKNLHLLPAEYRDYENPERTILDYLGGMMDGFAIEQYEIYFGNASSQVLFPSSGNSKKRASWFAFW